MSAEKRTSLPALNMKRMITSAPGKYWREVADGCAAASSGSPQWKIRTADAAQTIDGFGGCFNELGWRALSVLNPVAREEVLRELFDPQTGCRFNLCRMPMGANDFATGWYSYNETPGDLGMKNFSIARDREAIIPFIQAAREIQPALRLWASPWCPPSWMKVSGRYASSSVNSNWGQGEGNSSTDLVRASHLKNDPDILRAYADYFVKFLQAYRVEGIPVEAVHPQNEVFANQIFPSCLWTKELLVTFIADYLRPAFRRAGLDTAIWLGTINGDDREYVEWALNHPRLAGIIEGVGVQWAAKKVLPGLRRPPRLKIMQTESECHNGSNSWEKGLATFGLLCHYFAHGANSYMYWNLALDEWGLSNWGWRQNSMVTVNHATGEVVYNPDFFIMRHFSGAVQTGARYLQSAGLSEMNHAVFLNPDGSVVAMVENPADSEEQISVELDGGACAVKFPSRSVSTLWLRAS